MKIKLFRTFILILLVAMSLISCAHGNKFVIKSGKFVDKATGLEYFSASWEYEAMAITDEIHGEYTDKYDLTFYRVGSGVDPSKILTDEVGTVYYTKNVTLPILEDTDSIKYADVCNEYDELVATVTDKVIVTEIANLFLNGYNAYESMYFVEGEPAVALNRRIKFAYSELGIYYVLAYVEYAESFCYYDANGQEKYSNKVLFNRYTKTYVPLEESLSGYFTASNE